MSTNDVKILGVLYIDSDNQLKLNGDGFDYKVVIDRPVIRKSNIVLYYPTKHEFLDIVEARFESEIDFVVYEDQIWKTIKLEMNKDYRTTEHFEETIPMTVFVIS